MATLVRWRNARLLAAALAMTLAAGASAASLSDKQLEAACAAALRHWRAGMEAKGLTGMQAESEACLKTLEKRPSQRQAVLCAAIDHFSELDAMNFPESLQPPYFRTDPVFAL
jgi:hypothetical protein